MLRQIRNHSKTNIGVPRLAAGRLVGIRQAIGGVVTPAWCDGKREWYGPHIGRFLIGDLPAIADVHEGATAIIYSPAISGVTPREQIVRADRLRDGTRDWVYDAERTLFSGAAIDGTPIAAVTVGGSGGANSGTIATLGTIPANWWIKNAARLGIEVFPTRGATATATCTIGVAIGGTTIWSVSAIAAAATRVAQISGAAYAVSGSSQFITATLTPLTSAAIGGSTNPGLTATGNLAIDLVYSAATTGDILELGSFRITLGL